MSRLTAREMSNLECYMDDLVDCFEDFVKKSLLIISVALGALVVMLGYVLKVVCDRQSMPPSSPLPSIQDPQRQTGARLSCKNDHKTTQFSKGDVSNSQGPLKIKEESSKGKMQGENNKDSFSDSTTRLTISDQSSSKNIKSMVKTESNIPVDSCPVLARPMRSCCSSCCPDTEKLKKKVN